MRTIVLSTLAALVLLGCKNKAKQTEENTSMAAEQETTSLEWETLFDGTSFDNWKVYNGGEVAEPWSIEEGAMVFNPPAERPKGATYDLISKNTYTNFVLSMEWMIAEGGNSGIFWGIHEDENFYAPYQTGPEIQVLDNERHPDSKNGLNRHAGALYDMVEPSEDVTKPAGEWNTCTIKIDHENNIGEVTLNGTVIVSFAVDGSEWDEMVANSKFATWEGFGAYPDGHIGVQDHGDRVAYRNIKIAKL